MEIKKNEIRIIPENEMDEAYIEKVLCLTAKDQACFCKRIAPFCLDHAIAYLNITKEDSK